MIEKIATRVSKYMCVHLNTTEQDQLTYKYGLEVLLGELSKYILLLIVFYSMGDLYYGLTSLMGLLLVKHYVGGYHANTYWGCFFTTLSVLLLGKLGPILPVYILNIVGVCTLVIIWVYAPVYSKNKQDIDSVAKIRMKVCAVVVVFSIICLNTWSAGAFSAVALISSVTVFLITPCGGKLFKRRRCSYEKTNEETVPNP